MPERASVAPTAPSKDSVVYVAGHRGLVGGAIVRRLLGAGYSTLLTRTHAELDLTRQAAVEAFFTAERPDYVFLALPGLAASSQMTAIRVTSSATIC